MNAPEIPDFALSVVLGVGLAASRVLAPVRDEPPAERVKRDFAGPVLAADDQQVLARCGIPPRRVIVEAAIADVQPIDNGVTQWSAALNYSPAHARRM